MRRYSHLGSVRHPKGRPLARAAIVELWRANALLGWVCIAGACGVGRSTLYRALEGGNAHESTARAIEGFAERWKRADDAYMASLMRRWSPARRAAQKTRAA